MICFKYEVKDSLIPHSGKGLFTTETISAGKVLVAPDNINDICRVDELVDETRALSSVRWFEDYCSVAQHWPDECYINHSFSANSLWHLGFTIALRDIKPGEEITMDYSHLLAEGVEAFTDSITGKTLRGLGWEQAFKTQLSLLQKAMGQH